MPGKGTENAWRYVTPPELLRTVAASDGAGAAGIEAIVAKLTNHFDDIVAAYDNCLYVYAIADATVTGFVVEVWVDPKVVGIAGAERWCRAFVSATLANSAVLQIRDIPVGDIKVAIKSYAGSGNIKICTAKSM